MLDMPDVVATLVEEPDPHGPARRQGRRRAAVHLVDAGDRGRDPRRCAVGVATARAACPVRPADIVPRRAAAFDDSRERSARLADVASEREIMTWEMFGEASRDLAQMVADDGTSPT